MADVNVSTLKLKGRRSTKSKTPLRVDLTAMVDLGFVLITFFVFTTTMAELKAMKLFVPAGDQPTMQVGESTALTLILDESNIYYFTGSLQLNGENLKETNYQEIANVLLSYKDLKKMNSW